MSRKITLVWLLLLTSVIATAQATKRYVKEGETGNGTSWVNASGDIQNMIDLSASGDEIWVAKGTYYPEHIAGTPWPGQLLTSRDKAFVLKDGVKLYGGFAGIETSFTQRNLALAINKTTLSGDLGNAGNNSDNAYHVVVVAGLTITPETVLDGFTITGGNANGVEDIITISGVDVNQNYGGGFCSLAFGYGGTGTDAESLPTLSNCTFYKNSAALNGGGFYSKANISNENAISRPTLENCVFNENNAGGKGGGFYSYAKSDLNYSNSSPTLNNCTFYKNSAIVNGGGLYSNSFFSGPTTNDLYIDTPKIYNTIFWANTKGTVNNIAGADIKIEGEKPATLTSGEPTIEYCLTQENSDYSSGAGIINNLNPFFKNVTNGDFSLNDNSPAINKGNQTNLEKPKTNYALNANLIYITLPSKDIVGNQRIFQDKLDMGAYEGTVHIFTKDNNNRVYVKKGGAGLKDGSSWTNAAPELSDVLDWSGRQTVNASNPLSIWVAAGTYKPKYIAGGGIDPRNKTFLLTNEVKLYGGFVGTETTLANRNLANGNATKTILSGDLGVTHAFWSNTTARADNVYHVVLSVNDNNQTVLDSFTIIRSEGNSASNIIVDSETISNNFGGGMCNFSSSPSVSNCIFYQNLSFFGGGMYNSSSSPSVSNCIFSNNVAKKSGGGMSNNSSSSIIVSNCTFDYNAAEDPALAGGGISNDSSSINIYNSIFWDNKMGVPYNGSLAGADIKNNNNSITTIEHSLLQLIETKYPTVGAGKFSFASTDKNIYNKNPNFAALTSTGHENTLQVCSPAIARGIKTISGVTMPLKDITGETRHNTTIDLGAHENFLTPPASPIIATTTPFSPVDNATSVTISSNLEITFNTDVNFGTGNIEIYEKVNNTTSTLVETFNVVSSTKVSITANKVTINPTNDLVREKDYYVKINASAIRGCSRNFYAGITNAATWNFKTEGLITTTINSSFADFSRIYGHADFDLTATSNPSRTVTYSITGGTGTITLSGINNKTVKLVKVGPVKITASVAATATHTAATKEITLTITKKALTINATANNKTYDGTKTATFSSVNLVGKVGTDIVSLTVGTSNFDTKNVGTNKPITLTGYTLSGSDKGNYTLSIPTNLTANINSKATPTVTFDNLTVTYGDPEFDLTASSNSTGNITYSITGGTGTATLSGTNNKTVKVVKVGTVKITASVVATATHAAETKEIVLTINKKALTINATANNKTYDGTKTAILSNVSLVGNVGTDVVSLTTTGTAEFNSAAIGTNKAITLTGYSLLGTDKGNYTLSIPTNLIADISGRAKATITFGDITKMYGDDDFDLTASSNSTEAINYQILPGGTGSASIGGTDNKTVTLGKIGIVNIKVSIASNTTFDANFKIIILTIKEKNITITAVPKKKLKGDIDPALEYTVSPALIGNDILVGSLIRTPGENIKKYEIQSNLNNPNYKISYVSAAFTIYKKIAGDINKNGVIDYPTEVAGDVDENRVIDYPTEKEGDVDGDGLISDSEISGDSNGNGFLDSNTWSDNNGDAITKEETLFELVTIFQKWADTIFFKNTDKEYSNFEWYRNGIIVPGANDSYYSSDKLGGTYYVIATLKGGVKVKSNVLTVDKRMKVKPLLKAYPNPVNTSSKLTVETTVESKLLEGTTLIIYNINGDVIQKENMTSKKIFITSPKGSGVYIIRLLLTNGLSFSTNIIVK